MTDTIETFWDQMAQTGIFKILMQFHPDREILSKKELKATFEGSDFK